VRQTNTAWGGEKGLEENDVFEELKNIIGTEAAKRLIDHYSGSNIYIPQRILLKLKYKKIIEEFKQGANYRDLSVKYGYTELHIRRIVHRLK
jgi:Mor family transcriptional regulator